MPALSVTFSPHSLVAEHPYFAAAKLLCERIQGMGQQAYFVGGGVRDLLLFPHILPHDLDIASTATPEELQRRFAGTELVGKAFGVCLVVCNKYRFDVATFREDGPYSNRRHPDFIRKGTLLQDSQRRDFTVNAIYYDPVENSLVDPHGGIADVAARILRCVGSPQARLQEDALRIVRLARFAANLAFTVDPPTLAAAQENKDGLNVLSKERFLTEFSKVKKGSFPAFLENLEKLQGLREMLPEELTSASAPTSRAAIARLQETHIRYPWLAFALQTALRLENPFSALTPWEAAQKKWPVPRSEKRGWKFLRGMVTLENEHAKNQTIRNENIRNEPTQSKFSNYPIWIARVAGLWEAEAELCATELLQWSLALLPNSEILGLFSIWIERLPPEERESGQSWWHRLTANAVSKEEAESAFVEMQVRNLPASVRAGWTRISQSQAAVALLPIEPPPVKWRRPLAASNWTESDLEFLKDASRKI